MGQGGHQEPVCCKSKPVSFTLKMWGLPLDITNERVNEQTTDGYLLFTVVVLMRLIAI